MAVATARSVPITLLTGFLGSGKTTLCNRWVREPAMRNALVVVNEAGEISVDHHLVEQIEERVAVLPSGCVCCALRQDLVHVLTNPTLIEGRDAVLLETSGLADPTPLLATVSKHPALQGRYHLARVSVALDATRGPAVVERFAEAAKQLALADHVLITKCDLADPEQIAAAHALARAVCPEASVERQPGPWKPVEQPPRAPSAGVEQHDRHVHTHGVRTFVVESEGATDFRTLAAWLSMVTQFNGDRLLRLKGLLRVSDHHAPVVVQTVQHVVYPTYTLPTWPGERRTRLVGITQGMGARLFDELVASLRAIVDAE